MTNEQHVSSKGKPRRYIPFRARGYINDVWMEFDIKCPDCDSDWIKKDGFNRDKEQMFECKKCKRNFPFYERLIENLKEYSILKLYCSGCSAKTIAKELGLHTSTVSTYLDGLLH